ncbi:MAG TPA: tripartite tricarboxylate transporter permease [Opitutales bacterium]|nr:tripartite tricarboxylate transporter permease [Opitutales bacterium]
MEGLSQLIDALQGMMNPITLFHVFWATLLGISIGILPGLTATLALTLMTTLTLRMNPESAILVLICIYVGTIYGGSRTAILLNIPGTPASAATTLDGFPLAQAGMAGKAMGIATSGSVLGTIIGMIGLAIFAPALGELALGFQSYEFFWLALFGVVISGRLTALEDPIKGWLAGFIGLLIAMVGQESLTGYSRFSYNSAELTGGFALLPVMVGIFGLAEILVVMKTPMYRVAKSTSDSVIPKIRDVVRYWRTILRSGLTGTFTGLVPGVGEDMGAWVSYALTRNASKEKEKFGKGSVEGLMAAEAGNSAAVPGSIIPVLTLAVPGSAPAAVLLAALYIHGVQPGPMIMEHSPHFVFNIVAMIFLASIAILVLGLLLTKPMIYILRVPRDRLMPVIVVLCTVGSFAVASRVFDIYIMLIFGVIGFILREMKYPMAPLILGVVLGPILDENLRRSLNLSDGDLTPFFTRPISLILCLAIVLTIALGSKPVANFLKRQKAVQKTE